jgi:predicted lipoprotein with Yx(FWY)xxD motif
MTLDPRTMSAFRLPFLGGVALALIVSACSTGATASPSAAPPSAVASASPSTAAASPSAAASASAATGQTYEVTAATDAKIGKYLAGEDGKTLYTFKKDTAGTSNCNSGCIESWPAFTLDAGEQVKGAAGVTGTFTTIARSDGSMQVTYNGAPLYYYGADTKAGDVNGQGLFNLWFAAKP